MTHNDPFFLLWPLFTYSHWIRVNQSVYVNNGLYGKMRHSASCVIVRRCNGTEGDLPTHHPTREAITRPLPCARSPNPQEP